MVLGPVEGRRDLPEALRVEGAFLPVPLPSDDLTLTVETFRVVADTHLALGALAEAARRLGDVDRIVRLVRHREVQASARLDGVPAVLAELFVQELAGVGDGQPDETLRNYVRAAELGIAVARQGYELDVELLGEISALTSGLSAEGAPHCARISRWSGVWVRRAAS
jgi:Fic/DOC family N-terminal